MSTFWVVII